jgi:hypothetical protein
MIDRMPLGDYEAFRRWSGKPRAWGPQGSAWRAWFGGKVVDGLCEVIDEHLSAKRGAAAIGCVPWLTSEAVVDRLLNMSACCVVLDKDAYLPKRLVTSFELGFPNVALTQLAGLTPAVDGEALTVGPYTPRELTELDLGPVRVLGHRGRHGDDRKPLPHAKLLVLGELTHSHDPWGECSEPRFEPQTVWWGSANWTNPSQTHLEAGFACDDPALVREATDFLAEVIAFSEPVGTTCAGPEPNLVRVEYDDAAMAAAAEEIADDGDPEQHL